MSTHSQNFTPESLEPEETGAPSNAFATNQSSRKGLNWTPEMVEALLNGLVQQVRLGKRAQGGFKPEAYSTILPELQKTVRQQGLKGGYLQITTVQVKNKVSSLKALHTAWKELIDQSGVGRDPDTGAVTATDDWWKTYLAKVSAAILNCMGELTCLRPAP